MNNFPLATGQNVKLHNLFDASEIFCHAAISRIVYKKQFIIYFAARSYLLNASA